MTTLHNAQDAIREAIEGGNYEPTGGQMDIITGHDPQFHSDSIRFTLLDPAFWSALGKARGWSEIPFCDNCHNVSNYFTHCGWCNGDIIPTHIGYAKQWFSTQMSPNKVEEEKRFWQSLP